MSDKVRTMMILNSIKSPGRVNRGTHEESEDELIHFNNNKNNFTGRMQLPEPLR